VAIATAYPYVPVGDQMTIEECLSLLKDTKRPVAKSTLRRWIKKSGTATECHGGRVYVSFSDVLVIHAEAVDHNS